MIRVLLADDQHLVRSGIAGLLELTHDMREERPFAPRLQNGCWPASGRRCPNSTVLIHLAN